ncbi:MAG: ATP-dependent DNA helicase RecG [Gammaproteobacteria bacterium]|jgi:ATP-dependent DNA helicase RecG|nr:ATP-dependent DNA helicase RecG [Gammaproteobacteria bacterium]MBT4781666.1 ATP-dependent DNA helicase RecG [Gammaproteobacteria bacterium]MBT6316895.1 ATP-dependent DNA helicase RecG [Gammaproteobacteria bacterium]MBT6547949.1 ATP-dependent DNA helicase RecG [Gammaproteobacteria bacterium]MBT7763339.1 ATP-dependent DNA helicase RecG [Gammaproteobacteria bacterium]
MSSATTGGLGKKNAIAAIAPKPRSLDAMSPARLKGVGPALEKKLAAIGITSIQDLLFHLPLRYEDRTRITLAARAQIGEYMQFEGEVTSCDLQFGKRRSLRCSLRDSSGSMTLRFFHFSAAQKDSLAVGTQLRVYGEVKHGRAGFELFHPEYKPLSQASQEVSDTLTPIYPTTEGLMQPRLRSIIGQAVELVVGKDAIEDYLPADLVAKFNLASLTEAIKQIHRPTADAFGGWDRDAPNPGRDRLAFEELLTHRLSLRRLRDDAAAKAAPQFVGENQLIRGFLSALPFELTGGQQRAFAEISEDLARPTPMLRLLQGDVGSGKTVVAALSALRAIDAGYQVALMAPTEILAEQHAVNFRQWFEPLGIEVGWHSGKQKGKPRAEQLERVSAGFCQILVGTHALFQGEVIYAKLGLIIIDEQHRFGVQQRLALREKAASMNINPHQLVMTATPIPRTLAMSAYADLDNSIIDELPPGRTPVNTLIVSNERRGEVVERIAAACENRSQAYWVCTLIDESEVLQCQAAEVTAQQLAEQLPQVRVGLVHGRMKPVEKAEVMARFKAAEIDLLVATTVIEVGVDVPNSSLMVIENPERLGLAQLHQLRGRVGRGSIKSHCILLYQSPLSRNGKERLGVMRESNDGFYIAEKDLELRGPGQVLGTAQTGLMEFRIADLVRDAAMLDDVKDAADHVLGHHPQVVDSLVRRWLGENIHYANV